MLINMYILKSDENLPLQIMKNYSPPLPTAPKLPPNVLKWIRFFMILLKKQ